MSSAEHTARILDYEASLRQAADRHALGQRIVSGLDPLVGYVSAVLLLGAKPGRRRVAQISDVARVDRTAPLPVFAERLDAALAGLPAVDGVSEHTRKDVDETLGREWQDLAAPQVIRVPLPDPWNADQLVGVLFLFRDGRMRHAEREILTYLSGVMGHALAAHTGKSRLRIGRLPLARIIMLAVLALLLVTSLIPFRLSVTAEAEIAPRDPVVMTSPLDGVVEEVLVSPNQAVAAGMPLVALDTQDLANAVDIARQELFVARSELRAVQQAAFGSAQEKARIGELEARVALAEAELAHAQGRFERAELRSPMAGVAVVEDPSAWRGRPVQTGERILEVADPAKTEIAVRLPVADAIPLPDNARARLFLDGRPLDVIEARLERLSFVPVQTPDGLTVYEGVAHYVDSSHSPRIGARGAVKLYGEPSTLFMFLFRRPIAWLAQTLNW